MVISIHNNLHHLAIISFGFITLCIKVVGFSTYALGIGHQFQHTFIAVVFFILADAKIPKVGKCTATRMANLLDGCCKPCAIA